MDNEIYCLFCLDTIDNHEYNSNEIDFGCSCKINFHKKCMDVWLSSHRFVSCPLCRHRQPINNNITIIISQSPRTRIIPQNDAPFILPFMLVVCVFIFILILVFYSSYIGLT